MGNLANTFLQAVNIATQAQINRREADITVEAIILSFDQKDTSKYTIRINGQGTPSAARGAAGYHADDRVWVTIPRGDYSNEGQIIGLVGSISADSIVARSDEDTYECVTPNMASLGTGVGYTLDASHLSKVLWNGSDDLPLESGIGEDIDNAIDDSEGKFEITTNISSNLTYGSEKNFGIRCVFGSIELVLDINDLQGNPYCLMNEPQRKFFIQNNLHDKLSKIEIFANGLVNNDIVTFNSFGFFGVRDVDQKDGLEASLNLVIGTGDTETTVKISEDVYPHILATDETDLIFEAKLRQNGILVEEPMLSNNYSYKWYLETVKGSNNWLRALTTETITSLLEATPQEEDWEINSEGVIISYKGSEKIICLPVGTIGEKEIKVIGNGTNSIFKATFGKTIEAVIIPVGVYAIIADHAFDNLGAAAVFYYNDVDTDDKPKLNGHRIIQNSWFFSIIDKANRFKISKNAFFMPESRVCCEVEPLNGENTRAAKTEEGLVINKDSKYAIKQKSSGVRGPKKDDEIANRWYEDLSFTAIENEVQTDKAPNVSPDKLIYYWVKDSEVQRGKNGNSITVQLSESSVQNWSADVYNANNFFIAKGEWAVVARANAVEFPEQENGLAISVTGQQVYLIGSDGKWSGSDIPTQPLTAYVYKKDSNDNPVPIYIDADNPNLFYCWTISAGSESTNTGEETDNNTFLLRAINPTEQSTAFNVKGIFFNGYNNNEVKCRCLYFDQESAVNYKELRVIPTDSYEIEEDDEIATSCIYYVESKKAYYHYNPDFTKIEWGEDNRYFDGVTTLEFSFLKTGAPGTNGTNYVCRFVFGGKYLDYIYQNELPETLEVNNIEVRNVATGVAVKLATIKFYNQNGEIETQSQLQESVYLKAECYSADNKSVWYGYLPIITITSDLKLKEPSSCPCITFTAAGKVAENIPLTFTTSDVVTSVKMAEIEAFQYLNASFTENGKTVTVTIAENFKEFKGDTTYNIVIINDSLKIPILLLNNRFEYVAINNWDGQSISLDENNNTILSPTAGFGKKEEDESFTGVMLGDILPNKEIAEVSVLPSIDNDVIIANKIYNIQNTEDYYFLKSTSDNAYEFAKMLHPPELQGIIGLNHGERTFSLDASNGSAWFKGHVEATSGKIGNVEIDAVASQINNRNLIMESNIIYTSTDYMIANYIPSTPLESGKTYTITICAAIHSSNIKKMKAIVSAGYQNIAEFSFSESDVDKGKIMSYTFTAKYYTDRSPEIDLDNANIALYKFGSEDSAERTSSATIYWIKVEEGRAAGSTWTAAPEDGQNDNLIENTALQFVECSAVNSSTREISILNSSVKDSNISAIIFGTYPAGTYTLNMHTRITDIWKYKQRLIISTLPEDEKEAESEQDREEDGFFIKNETYNNENYVGGEGYFTQKTLPWTFTVASSFTLGVVILTEYRDSSENQSNPKFQNIKLESGPQMTIWSNPDDARQRSNVNTSSYSWRFSPTDGMFMWNGKQGTGETGKNEDGTYKDPGLAFKIKDGLLYMRGNGEFTGKITANEGEIAGWGIAKNDSGGQLIACRDSNGNILEPTWANFSGASNRIGLFTNCPEALTQSIVGAPSDKNNWRIVAGSHFGVDAKGNLYASAGKIACLEIDSSSLFIGSSLNSDSYAYNGTYISSTGINCTEGVFQKSMILADSPNKASQGLILDYVDHTSDDIGSGFIVLTREGIHRIHRITYEILNSITWMKLFELKNTV